jgi:hypothetical protein
MILWNWSARDLGHIWLRKPRVLKIRMRIGNPDRLIAMRRRLQVESAREKKRKREREREREKEREKERERERERKRERESRCSRNILTVLKRIRGGDHDPQVEEEEEEVEEEEEEEETKTMSERMVGGCMVVHRIIAYTYREDREGGGEKDHMCTCGNAN